METQEEPPRPDKGKGKRLISEMPPPPPRLPPPQPEAEPQPEPEPPVNIDELFTMHFEKAVDPNTKNVKLTCNYCDRSFEFKEGERNDKLMNHLSKEHPEKIGNDEESLMGDDDSSHGSTGSDLSIYRYSHNRVKTAAAKLVCTANLRLNFADSEHYENFIQACNPMAKRITRQELIEEIIRLIKESTLVLLNDLGNLSNRVSVALDFWSDQWDRWHYIGVSCRWIDETWTLQKRLIAFKVFSAAGFPHKPSRISRATFSILKKFGLEKKVFSISFDNECANAVGLETLANSCKPTIGANFFHVRCICDVLSLCAQDVVSAFEEKLDPIRKAAMKLCDETFTLGVKWGKFCKENALHPKIFVVDLGTGRWDSTYKMLSGSYEYRHILCSFFSEEPQLGIDLSPDQWDACSDLCKVLKTCKDAVEELSRVYRSTSVLVVDHFVKIAVHLNSLLGCDGLGECVAGMIAKWLNQFREIPTVFLLAKVFDPRVRLDGLEKMLELYYDALFPAKDDRTPSPSSIVANVKACLYELFQEYKGRYSDILGIDTSSAAGSGDKISLSVRLENLFNEMSQKRPRSYSTNPHAEIESYLTADFEYVGAEFDVLKWWSRRNVQFPIMSLIAMDILAVPASIVSATQAFNTGGGSYMLEERKSYLSFQNLENQLVLGDWTKAEGRDQENDYEEEQEDGMIFDPAAGEIME